MGMEKPPVHGSTTGDCKPLTTFVHTNTGAFREVVQRLTGPSEGNATTEEQTAKVAPITKRTPPKLHGRRKCMKPKLEIVKPNLQYHKQPGASPSFKSRNSSFPSSPVSGSGSFSFFPSPTTPSTLFFRLTIMEDEKKQGSVINEINIEEEEKAIKERRFYLHPSPRFKASGFNEPELLNLFPLASPKACEKV
uniref:VQ domain-containing protein n=1 Tax=Medicago truncatula TaxID=3880 RepID=I3S824_MEDTR|nr:unknown [Medicago truncatula]